MENGRKQQHSLGGLRVKTPKPGPSRFVRGTNPVPSSWLAPPKMVWTWHDKVTSWPAWFSFEVEILRIFVWEHNWKRPLLVGAFDAGLKYCGRRWWTASWKNPPISSNIHHPCHVHPGMLGLVWWYWHTRTPKIRNAVTALEVQYRTDLKYLFGLGLLSSSAMVC